MAEYKPELTSGEAAENTSARHPSPESVGVRKNNAMDAGFEAAKQPSDKPTSQDSSFQNYLFARAGKSDAPAWTDTTKGRLAVRFFSRGVIGAAFFVAGSRMAVKQLEGYHPEHWDRSRPLQWIAKGIDSTLTPLIREGVTLLARVKHPKEIAQSIGQQAVTFRNTRNYTYKVNGQKFTMNGRTYGSDIVGFTFDFAMMSVGDALTRNIVQAFDPNVKQSWRLNDEGKAAAKGENWHFAPGAFAKWVGQTAWRIVSKNQMEDWVAAIPYAFQMKFQRQFLCNIFEKRWDGHKLVFDHSWNGGAYRINQMGQKVADYQLPGALDLHFRFVGYNVYTQMFREGYDTLGQKWNDWKNNGYHVNLHFPNLDHPFTSTMDWIGHASRYVMKSAIKANMYMNPAVLFFWAVRVPQSKWRGRQYVERDPLNLHLGRDANVFTSGTSPFAWSNYEHFRTDTTMDRFEKGFSMTLNPIGQACNWVGTKAADLSDVLERNGLWPQWKSLKYITSEKKGATAAEQLILDRNGRRKFMHEYTDAALSYTPYIAAKQEFGLRVDDAKGDGKPGQMDLAIYKFMDDVASFKFKQIPADVKKMWVLGTRFEDDIKVREGGLNSEDAQQLATAHKKPDLPITPESTVVARSVERQQAANLPTQDDKPKHVAKKAEAANDAEHGRQWAQSVVGSDIHPARIHSGTQVRH